MPDQITTIATVVLALMGLAVLALIARHEARPTPSEPITVTRCAYAGCLRKGTVRILDVVDHVERTVCARCADEDTTSGRAVRL
jgi:hypothetical protein